MDHILETAHWLCRIQNEDGGWGLYPKDNSHNPITGEVALSLASVSKKTSEINDSLTCANRFLSQSIDDATTDPAKIQSTVHLCWLVLGNLSCGGSIADDRMLILLKKLAESQSQGWSWKLPEHGGASHESAIYPTYLALWTLSMAKKAGWRDSPDLGHTVAWILTQRSAEDMLWGHGLPQEERVLCTSYALLALHYSGVTIDTKFADLTASFRSLSDAALSLKSTQTVVVEPGRWRDNHLVPWHHCVLQQVILSYLFILGSSDMTRNVVPRIFNVFFDYMKDEDGCWRDPKRQSESPYVGADSLFAMNVWSRTIEDQMLAPSLAVQLGRALSQFDSTQNRIKEQPYRYQWRYVGLSKPAYFILVGVCLFVILGLAIVENITLDRLWGLRILAILMSFMWYVPLAEKHPRYDTRERVRFILALLGGSAFLITMIQLLFG